MFERFPSEQEEVPSPDVLVRRCSFPVWVPSTWPEVFGVPGYFLADFLGGLRHYIVRTGDEANPAVLVVTGLAAGRNVFGSNPLRPVAGLPFVGGIEELQGGEEEPAAVAWHAVLQPPGTVVHVAAVERVASGAVNAEIVLDVARSLQRIEGHE